MDIRTYDRTNAAASLVKLLNLHHIFPDTCTGIVQHFSIELQINLKLILVSGKTNEFLFDASDSVAAITQHVYDNWPVDWADELLPSTNILRLIYQGRFLHSNVTLSGESKISVYLCSDVATDTSTYLFYCKQDVVDLPTLLFVNIGR